MIKIKAELILLNEENNLVGVFPSWSKLSRYVWGLCRECGANNRILAGTDELNELNESELLYAIRSGCVRRFSVGGVTYACEIKKIVVSTKLLSE